MKQPGAPMAHPIHAQLAKTEQTPVSTLTGATAALALAVATDDPVAAVGELTTLAVGKGMRQ